MSEALQKLSEMCDSLDSRAIAAYDKVTEAKATHESLILQASTARAALALFLEDKAADAPKFSADPAPPKSGRTSRHLAPALEEAGRQRRDVRGEVFDEFKRASQGVTVGQVRAALQNRGAVTTAQVQNAFDYWADPRRDQIEQISEKTWRHVDHRPKASAAPEPDMGNVHYADDGDAAAPTSNGADEDYVGPTSAAEYEKIVNLLDAAGDEGLTKDEIRTYGVGSVEIDDAEAARVIRQEDGRYYAVPEG